MAYIWSATEILIICNLLVVVEAATIAIVSYSRCLIASFAVV